MCGLSVGEVAGTLKLCVSYSMSHWSLCVFPPIFAAYVRFCFLRNKRYKLRYLNYLSFPKKSKHTSYQTPGSHSLVIWAIELIDILSLAMFSYSWVHIFCARRHRLYLNEGLRGIAFQSFFSLSKEFVSHQSKLSLRSMWKLNTSVWLDNANLCLPDFSSCHLQATTYLNMCFVRL